MGSHGGDQTAKPGNDATGCSETTVEINIKTLDSRNFTLRVDKCVPVPELKQQIASLTGVLTEQQRLICRGRVLRDDQLLSAYQVEDGHTLHLVERPPFVPMQGSSSDRPDPASGGEHNTGGRTGPEMLVGSFNISDQGDGYFPDLNRILSSVFTSVGMTRFGDVNEGLDLNQLPFERPATASGLNSARNSSNPGETLQPPIIPDSLTTLSQYLSHLRQEFLSIEGERMNSRNTGFSGRGGQNSEAAGPSLDTRGAIAPESLAGVMSSSRQMIVEQASECLSQLARQLEHHSDINDPVERSRIQSNAIRSGVLFQNLGALFLELGRTMTTLRMGQTPADALVNAGPSVFVSSTGPNPIMVQQLPFQHGSSSGSVPFGSVQLVPGLPGGSVGTSLRPSNIDIRIRTGSVLSRRDPTVSQPQTQLPPESATIVNPVQQNAPRADSNSQSQGQRVRAYPRGSIGILYPVLARVENTSGNRFRHQPSQTSNRSHNPNSTGEQHSMPSSATQHQSTASDGDNSLPADERHEQGFSFTIGGGFDQLFNEMEHFLNHDANSSGLGSNQRHGEAAQDNGGSGGSQATSEAVTDEGILFSNALRQLLPILHQNDRNLSSAEGNPIETQVDNTADEGASSSRSRRGSDSQSSPKRQRRE